jgi:hypothetical protein
MPREGAIIFRDLVGKLDVLNVECDKCGRFGRYHLDRLIERYGIDAKLFDWSDEITADCSRKQAMKPGRYLWSTRSRFAEGCVNLPFLVALTHNHSRHLRPPIRDLADK